MNLRSVRGLRFPEEHLIRFFFKNQLDQCPGRVLELGCGNGCNLTLFFDYGWEVFGLDLDSSALADAEYNFSLLEPAGRYRFLKHDLLNGLPSGLPESFDAVVISQVLCVITREAAESALRALRGRLSPRGMLYLRTRSVRDYRYRRGPEVGTCSYRLETDDTGELGHLNTFYYEHELVALLTSRAGLDVGRLEVFHLDWDNVQGPAETLVRNAEVVIWGQA